MYPTILKHKCFLPFLFNLCAMAYILPDSAWTETWICPRPGQAELYTDREWPGCRQLGEAKTYSPVTSSPSPKPSSAGTLHPSVSGTATPNPLRQFHSRKPSSFPEVSLSLPILSVGQDKLGSITGSWGGFVAQLTVGYKADGKGPEILGDSNLMPVSSQPSRAFPRIPTNHITTAMTNQG